MRTDYPDGRQLYFDLLKEWCDGLCALQLTESKRKEIYGGLICPACGRIHGRSADAILPMMYLAKHTNDQKYHDCAHRLFLWSNNLYHEDGYYFNDLENNWKGITVFFCVQLGETLDAFSDLLTAEEKEAWRERYFKTCDFVEKKLDKIGATINYPATGAYAMALAAKLSSGETAERFRERAHAYAKLACAHILQDGILFGEGHPLTALTPKGARAVDIGYNLEESLPALAEYCYLEEDPETETCVWRALETHMKFLLPDGGIDNSFGSRSFKWTYWGSRTSDGFQALAARMSKDNPLLQQAAYRNALLLKRCTYGGLLYGGPMFYEAGESPCVHHTFCHAKALAKALMILETHTEPSVSLTEKRIAPPMFIKGTEYFPLLRTYLVQKGSWRATLTDYDYEYCPASHASGGALTLLWHSQIGPVCVGTMNRYYCVEPGNCQILVNREAVCLTPRVEYLQDGTAFRNIHDLSAEVFASCGEDEFSYKARGCMRDEAQNGDETFEVTYRISTGRMCIQARCSRAAEFIFPVIAETTDQIRFESDREIHLHRNGCALTIQADNLFISQKGGLVFNPVGGFLAYPIRMRLPAGLAGQLLITG